MLTERSHNSDSSEIEVSLQVHKTLHRFTFATASNRARSTVN